MKSILPDQYAVEKQFNSRADNFLSKLEIGKSLRSSNFQKEKGFSCLDLFKFIYLLVFSGKNLYRTLQTDDGPGWPEKDAIYLFLNSFLVKEFQGRSYDSMVTHTTIVFCRYIMLALENRDSKDPRTLGNLFYLCCDEFQDISFAEAFQLILTMLKNTFRKYITITDSALQDIDEFISCLPTFLKGRLQLSLWSSRCMPHGIHPSQIRTCPIKAYGTSCYHLLKTAKAYSNVINVHIYSRLWKWKTLQKKVKFIPVKASSLASAI